MTCRQEAEGIPDVMTVPETTHVQRKRTQDARTQYPANYVPNMGTIKECQPEFLPTQLWTVDLLAKFADLRSYMAWVTANQQHTRKRQATTKTKTPPLTDWPGWYTFFTGETLDQQHGESPRQPQPPLLSFLVRELDQARTSKLIMKLAQHVETNPDRWTLSLLLWIFALLANTEKPLHSSVSSSLRTILRWIAEVRSELENPSSKEFAAANVIYYIIADYFGQNS